MSGGANTPTLDYTDNYSSHSRQKQSPRPNPFDIKRGSKKAKRTCKNKAKTPIRFDDDGKTDEAGEIVTVLGDASMKRLGYINNEDSNSRDRIIMRDETMNLNDRSSKELPHLAITSNRSTE